MDKDTVTPVKFELAHFEIPHNLKQFFKKLFLSPQCKLESPHNSNSWRQTAFELRGTTASGIIIISRCFILQQQISVNEQVAWNFIL